MNISISQIREAFREEYPLANWVEPVDPDYQTLTSYGMEWLLQQFHNTLEERGLFYTEGKGDCDKFAWLFRAYVIERNWVTPASVHPVPIFYGHYTTDQGVRHAINFPIVKEGDKLTARAIEPQPGGALKRLSSRERSTVTLLIG